MREKNEQRFSDKLNGISKLKTRIKSLLLYTFLTAYSVVTIYPLYFALVSSFKTDTEIFSHPFSLPSRIHFTNYIRAWKMANVGTYFSNSIFMTIVTIVLLVFVGTMGAFILSRFKFKLKSIVYMYFMLGMMIPVYSTIIPLAFSIGKYNLTNKYSVLILIYTAFQIPISIFILTGFMKSIPNELEESAIIDGCSIWRMYVSIILPLSKPAIATICIFNFIQVWNNLLFPLVFITDEKMKPLSIGLLSFFGEQQSDYSGVMSAIIISVIVPLIFYIIFQEKVEKGLTAGAVKG